MVLVVVGVLGVGLVALVVWVALHRSPPETVPAVLVEGTSWFLEKGELVGPGCDVCRIRLMARPVTSTPEGLARYELCCPACGKVPVRRAFSLQELLDLDRQATEAWASAQTKSKLFPSTPRPRW